MSIKTLKKNRALFFCLNFIGIGCLVGAFAQPLHKLNVYHQPEIDGLKNQYNKVYIRTVVDTEIPHGFNEKKARLVAQIQQDYPNQKILLLAVAVITSGISMSIASQVVENLEIEQKVNKVKSDGKKELVLDYVKGLQALAKKAQLLENNQNVKELVNLYGDDDSEVDEHLQGNLANIHSMISEGHSLDYSIEQVYKIKEKNNPDEFKHIKNYYLDEYGE